MSTEAARKAGMSEHEIADMEQREADARMEETQNADALAAVAGEDETPAAETEPEQTETPVGEPEARQTPFVPTINTATPEGLDARLSEIKAEQKALKVKFGSGDMTPDAWADADEKLQDEREHLTKLRTKHESAQEANAQTAQQAVEFERRAFYRDAKKEGIDYDKDPALQKKLNTAFTVLAQDGERTIDDAYATWQEAHAMVKAMTGWKPPAPAIVPTTPKPAVAAAPRDAPRTLADLPAAAPASLEDDTAKQLAGLVGVDREVFMSKLPKAEVTRLLKMS